MTWWGWLILGVVLALVVLLVGLWQKASRLDRLHRRILSARTRIDKGLVSRNVAALKLPERSPSGSQSLENLRSSAVEALELSGIPLVRDDLDPEDHTEASLVDQRLLAESMVSRAIRDHVAAAGLDEPGAKPCCEFETVQDAARHVALVRTLHNQDVRLARALRVQWEVRLFHLAGRAPTPDFIDLDDVFE